MMFLTAMMMAQAPAAVPPAVDPAPAAKKQKRAQVCEYVELAGSRSTRRVCRDLEVGSSIRSVAVGTNKVEAKEAAVPTPNGAH